MLALVVATAGPARACLWDSDTLAAEAAGLPDAVRAIAGRFERNPPRYYEMRLKLASGKLKANPDEQGLMMSSPPQARRCASWLRGEHSLVG